MWAGRHTAYPMPVFWNRLAEGRHMQQAGRYVDRQEYAQAGRHVGRHASKQQKKSSVGGGVSRWFIHS